MQKVLAMNFSEKGGAEGYKLPFCEVTQEPRPHQEYSRRWWQGHCPPASSRSAGGGDSQSVLHVNGLFVCPEVRRAVEKVITEMNRTDGIYFEQRATCLPGVPQLPAFQHVILIAVAGMAWVVLCQKTDSICVHSFSP